MTVKCYSGFGSGDIATIPGPGIIPNVHFAWGHIVFWGSRAHVMDVANHCELASGILNGQGTFNLPLDISPRFLQERAQVIWMLPSVLYDFKGKK